MAKRAIKAAVVGGSTLLGRELLEEINNSAASLWDLRVLEDDQDADGQLISSGDEAMVVQVLNEGSFTGLDLVFFATPRETTAKFVDAAITSEAAVVDLTGYTSGRTGFVTRSPWVDGGQRFDLTTLGATIPEPAAVVLSLLADRLEGAFGATKVVATVLEPASQAGSAGVDELHQQTVNLLSFQELPQKVFGSQVAFNMQATLGEDALVRLGDIRQRVHDDLLLLGGNQRKGYVSFSLLQAPVFHGYVISAHVELAPGQGAEPDAVQRALEGSLILFNNSTPPSNQAAIEAGGVIATVGRDTQTKNACWVLLAADNLRITARNAVELGNQLMTLRPNEHLQ